MIQAPTATDGLRHATSAGIFLVCSISNSQTSTMKTILVIAMVMAMVGCSSPKELQTQMVTAQLVKIDTVFRYSNDPKQALTWRDDNRVDYVTYVPLNNSFLVGARMIVLVKR